MKFDYQSSRGKQKAKSTVVFLPRHKNQEEKVKERKRGKQESEK